MTKTEALALRNRFPHFPMTAQPYAFHAASGDVCFLNTGSMGWGDEPTDEMVSCNVAGACFVSEPASVVIPNITARKGWTKF